MKAGAVSYDVEKGFAAHWQVTRRLVPQQQEQTRCRRPEVNVVMS